MGGVHFGLFRLVLLVLLFFLSFLFNISTFLAEIALICSKIRPMKIRPFSWSAKLAAVFRAIYMGAWCGTHEVMPRCMRVWKALDCGPMLSASSVGSFGLPWVQWVGSLVAGYAAHWVLAHVAYCGSVPTCRPYRCGSKVELLLCSSTRFR